MSAQQGAPALDAYPTERGCPFNPPEIFDDLRRKDEFATVPVLAGNTPWLVTRYEDAKAILGSPDFSARLDNPGFPLMSATDVQQRDHAQPSLVRTDDPEHQTKRRRLTREFTVKKIRSMRPHIQQVIDEVIDELLTEQAPADLVTTVALPIPSRVICLVLGVPYAEHAFFQRKAREALSGKSDVETVQTALHELGAFVSELIDAKLQAPEDDLVSRLAHDYLKTEEIDRQEVINIAMTLLIAGFETTGNMISLGTALLLAHPDQRDLFLAGDEAFQANAVEEILRYLTIAHHPRQLVATVDTEIGGNTIRAGEGVLISLPATNRDGTAFEAPDEFDLARSARHHLAFSYGIHQCLGQSLARLELQLYFRTVFTRIPGLRLADSPQEYDLKTDSRAHGFNSLNVTW